MREVIVLGAGMTPFGNSELSQKEMFAQAAIEALEKLFSPAEWESVRGRLYVVHEHTDVDERLGELAWETIEETLPDALESKQDEAHEELTEELKSVFQDVPTREGFARVQAKLPEKRRFELFKSLEAPWPADVYMAPADAADGN